MERGLPLLRRGSPQQVNATVLNPPAYRPRTEMSRAGERGTRSDGVDNRHHGANFCLRRGRRLTPYGYRTRRRASDRTDRSALMTARGPELPRQMPWRCPFGEYAPITG